MDISKQDDCVTPPVVPGKNQINTSPRGTFLFHDIDGTNSLLLSFLMIKVHIVTARSKSKRTNFASPFSVIEYTRNERNF